MKALFRYLFVWVFSSVLIIPAEAKNYATTVVSETDSTQLILADANLKNGTRVWGILLKQAADSISVADFNIGIVTISRNFIEEVELDSLRGNVVVETVNGTSYLGEITGYHSGYIKMHTSTMGILNIQSNTIAKINLSLSYVSREGKTWFTNPNATRYFFAPSAIPLKKKEGYFQNAYLLANSVSIGVNNYFTIGGGVVIPLLFYVTPKVSFKVADKFYLGSGVLFTQSFITDFNLSAGIGYGLATYGTLEHNATIGLGYGFARFDSKYKTTPMPIVTVNGMARIAKKLSLVTENWLIPRGGYNKEVITYAPDGLPIYESVYQNQNFYSGAASLGLRIMPGVRTSVDFSVVGMHMNPGQKNWLLPYLDFVYKFN